MTSENTEPNSSVFNGPSFGPPQRPIFGPPQDGGAIAQQRQQMTRLVSMRSFGFGEPVVREKPLLRVPADSKTFLFSIGTEAMKEVAKRLGDSSRLATFLAFMRLTEPEREQLLALGSRPGSKVAEECLQIFGMFLADFPQFKGALDWQLFAKVVGVVTDRGTRLPSGEYVLYGVCGAAAHSFTPNAVIERRGDSESEMRAISYDGIASDEEITVNYLAEEKIFLAQKDRLALLAALPGFSAACVENSSDDATATLWPVLQRVQKVPPRQGEDNASREAELTTLLEDLRSIDKSLPFAMVAKAKARTNLANAFEELESQSTLRVAIALYEGALEDTQVALGGGCRSVAENLQRRIKTLQDQLEEP